MPDKPNAQAHNTTQRISIAPNGSNWIDRVLFESSQSQNSKNRTQNTGLMGLVIQKPYPTIRHNDVKEDVLIRNLFKILRGFQLEIVSTLFAPCVSNFFILLSPNFIEQQHDKTAWFARNVYMNG